MTRVVYGFVSAGGAPWYSGTLRKLPLGGRVFVNLPGRGYVGVGVVTGPPTPLRNFTIEVDGQPVPLAEAETNTPVLAELALLDDDETEWYVPVEWVKALPRKQAIRFKGRYGNQNSATKLTDTLTRETVLDRLGLDDQALVEAEAEAATPASFRS